MGKYSNVSWWTLRLQNARALQKVLHIRREMKEAPTYPDASKALTRMDRIKDSSTVTASKVVNLQKQTQLYGAGMDLRLR